ncbi:MAG: O-antigen ligase family protein [Patescibacteria group bacterium]
MIQLIPFIITLLLPSYLIRFSFYGVPTTLLEIIVYGGLCVTLIHAVHSKQFVQAVKKVYSNVFFKLAIILLLVSAITVFVSPDLLSAAGIWKAYFFDSLIYIFLYIYWARNKKDIDMVLASFSISAGLLVLGSLLLPRYGLSVDGRLQSIFSSPNYLALYITPALPVCWYLVTQKDSLFIKRLFLGLTFLVILAGVILTYSRGAWMALLGAGMVSLYFIYISRTTGRKNRVVKASSYHKKVLLVITGLVVSITTIGLLYSSLFKFRGVQSDTIRIAIWQQSISYIKETPLLGVGLGNFQNYFSEHTKTFINFPEYITPHALTPHNMVLNLWLQTGIIGLTAFLVVVVLFYTRVKNGILQEEVHTRGLYVALGLSMATILFQGLVDSAIWKNDLILVFWMVVISISVSSTRDV